MALLVVGLVLFIGIHSLPSFIGLRNALVRRLTFNGYQGLFSLIALAGLLLIIVGKARADFIPLWDPPNWGRHAAMALTLPAFILLSAAYLPSNIKRFTRHPMLWAVSLWSLAHLLTNGDLASVVLFGSLGAYSLLDMVSANKRGAALRSQRVSSAKDALVVVLGLLLYTALIFAHPYLFGAAIV